MNKVNRRMILVLTILLGIIIGIYSWYVNPLEEIHYFADNEIVNVKIQRFSDYDEFAKVKPNYIVMYDGKEELTSKEKGFVVGSVKMKSKYYDSDAEYKLIIEKSNGYTFAVTLMMKIHDENNKNVRSAEFIANDYQNSRFKRITLKKNDIIITTLNLKRY